LLALGAELAVVEHIGVHSWPVVEFGEQLERLSMTEMPEFVDLRDHLVDSLWRHNETRMASHGIEIGVGNHLVLVFVDVVVGDDF